MADDRETHGDLDELVQQAAEAASAFIQGDMRRYLALVKHTDDYTLMPPTGGDTTHGFEISDERLAEMERFFKTGHADLDVVQTYASGELAVLVAVERQHGRVPSLPPGASHFMTIEYAVHSGAEAVKGAAGQVARIQGDRRPLIHEKPEKSE